MLSRPAFVRDDAIAAAVAEHWLFEGAVVDYLPWGFGAYHWRVSGGDRALFGTLDRLAPRHTAASLEAAYAAAAALAAAGLESVCAPLPARSGHFTVDIGPGALSMTPWLDGRSPSEEEAREPEHRRQVSAALVTLHGTAPPDGLPSWRPCIGPEFADTLRTHTARPWTSGPLAQTARAMIAARHDAIADWAGRYLELADIAHSRRELWVATHGEPHGANQVTGPGGLKLVDWESLALAPRERDYAHLYAHPWDADPGLSIDPAMIELFALDWRLSEIAEYARWFSAPHTGNDDDHTALEGLRKELSPPEPP